MTNLPAAGYRFLFIAALGITFLAVPALARAADDYALTADSQRQDGVPRGQVTAAKFSSSKIFPGTDRDYLVYVPRQYDGTKPACVMIFQDGPSYANEGGQFRVPIVFDNLIHQGAMPVTIGVFVSPGTVPPAVPNAKPRSNRSYEYDSVSDLYARFLLEELLPEVGQKVKLSSNPECRGLGGISSGGICAWTVAWHRPDEFRRVLSAVGSFTNIRGGYVYPGLIRKHEKKPIRVHLQEGENDLDNLFGHWPKANLDMAAALKFAGYDHQLVMGDGGHNGKHGGAIMPTALRWLWRDWQDHQP